MNDEEFEEFIRRNPNGAMKLIVKAFEEKELLKIGNRSYVNAFRYPESRFDVKDLMPNGGSLQVLKNPDMLQPLSDPGKLFTDKYVIPPSSLIFKWADRIYDKKWWGEIAGGLTNAATVIQTAWNNMPEGGRIHFKGELTLSSALTLNMTKYVKALELTGEGETKSILRWEGSDYAITIGTEDPTIGYYYVKLKGFTIDCVSKTSGRNGLKIDKIGRVFQIGNIVILDADVGIYVDTNTGYIRGCKAVSCNTAIHSIGNAIWVDDCYITDATNYGIYVEGGISVSIRDSVMEDSATGAYIEDATVVVDNCYFGSNTTVDMEVHGFDSAYRTITTKIAECYFNSTCEYAIKVYYPRRLTIENCRSRNHSTAFLWFENTAMELLIVNPYVEDPYLLDASPTMLASRVAGLVIDSQRGRIGQIMMSSPQVTEGDVVVIKGIGYVGTTTSANDDCPVAVMYGNAGTSKPCVVCISGVTRVNVDMAVAVKDTIVTSTTGLKGTVDNTETNPKKIIGYAVEVIGAAGLAHIKI